MEITEEKLEEQATREAGALGGVRGTISVLNQNRRRVPIAPSLKELHEHAETLGRLRPFERKVRSLRSNPKKWNDIGGLKRELDDMLLAERNRLFREAVKGVKERRKESVE